MKRAAIVGLLGVLLIFSVSQVMAAEAASRIGVVDLNRAVNQSEEGKKAKGELEGAIKEKQAALDEKGKSLEKLKAEIEKQGSVMSAEARKGKEDELERQSRDYQRMLSDSQNDVRKKEGELTGGIVKELRRIIAVIAQEKNLDLVLDYNPAVISYADKNIDLTDEVIKKFDESRGKH